MENRILTEDEILAMSNKAKRERFLNGWKEWPVWGALPQLGLEVHRIGLPDGSFIVASEYIGERWNSVHFQHLQAGANLRAYHDTSSSVCIFLLTQLSNKLKEQKKG